jgi:FKBP-type peptidyl-prolyl cis-trans isomerase
MTKPELQIEYVQKGQGAAPAPGDTVVVHYTGWLTNGRKFDSSKDRGQPFEVEVGRGRVIEGWDVTLAQMRVGDHVRVTIPSELAYGSRSPGAGIPPNATLVFEIEMLDVRARGAR